ncbi:SAM-dependent methyltransferase [Mycobacterium sherrisii]|uniref:S-adenosyl-L-methionine-dependent methyltransferase n=1 Tax=Mycobacterium sherrisii TaxID=243061 RepID=A0A1E3SRW5_9MYCO|nr:SAM-dependent methyltransferase [Mycobacterium sherrisii]MCV7031214.1 SAM-dependent methyltransferase [Mycobacterium sherrisii]MEC4763620.1 SAM-dependent methyltransferase [Mycobacterium sherrisii]ODR04881.1 hypothetical protein BHQ21_16055 [Mycobacterium sherrisii]ORW78303.1 hypothetical protein AWC25_06925 [Mycobacterium sherrisii]
MARTADDTWGPDSGVGLTATFGAAVRALATSAGLINDPLAEALVRAAGVPALTRIIDDRRYADHGIHDALASALITLYGVQTRFFDDFLAAAGRAGIRQVVILGSGLDTRPYRLWWPPNTTLYELDQPDIIDFKTAVLQHLRADLNAHRRAVGVDLRADWLTALRRVGYDAAQPTVWIAETLLGGFLRPDAQNRFLDEVSAASPTGSRFAGDHLPGWAPWERFGLDADLAGLTYRGEFRPVPQYLGERGWETADQAVADVFAMLGMGAHWSGFSVDDGFSPRYLTATRSGDPHGPGMHSRDKC